MASINLILLGASVVCFAYAALNDRAPDYNRALAAGLLFLVGAMITR